MTHSMIQKHKKKPHLLLISLGIISMVVFVFGQLTYAQEDGSSTDNTVNKEEYQELNQQIEEKKLLIDEINAKIVQYEESLEVKQQEALTLEGQLSLLDAQVAQTNNDIKRINLEIERTALEIEKLTIDIEQKREELEVIDAQLANYIRLLNGYDQRSVLSVLLTNDSFSEFFDYIKYTQDIEGSITKNLISLQSSKQELEEEQNIQATKKGELQTLQERLTLTINDLTDQQEYKSTLLEETKENQELFEDLLEDAQLEQKQVNAEIYSIERLAREKLEEGGTDLLDSSATLSWPVASHKGISAYFHDPSYPYRKYFEHPAVDIRVGQGTPLYAAADGYVARAKNAGFGYSFIMIVHNDDVSTVYGHVSGIDVAEDDFVIRGQQIGLSGGMPGTLGAGRLTTGPHLHFEVRLNGIPVNPLDYLP